MKRYYEARAAEYDATTYELVRRSGDEAGHLEALERLVAGLSPGRMLDIACGTGWLTQLLRGEVVALDASPSMLRIARERVPTATFVHGTVPPLPFPDASFDRVLASHFYSHVEGDELRVALVREMLRVADEVVVVEQAWRPGLPAEAREARALRDGSVYRIYKRYLTASALADELQGEVLLETPLFIAVRTQAQRGRKRPARRERHA
jgi:ubiquinone/menaquinone biosynthesis C-methylase UbiE